MMMMISATAELLVNTEFHMVFGRGSLRVTVAVDNNNNNILVKHQHSRATLDDFKFR